MLIDLIVLEFSFFFATVFYGYLHNADILAAEVETRERGILAICLLIMILVSSPYRDILRRNFWTEMKQIGILAVELLIINVMILYFFRDNWWMSRSVILITFMAFFALGFVARVIWKRCLRHRFVEKGFNKDNTMIVICSRARAQGTLDNLRSDHYSRYVIRGFFLIDYDPEVDQMIGDVPVLGNAQDSIDYATHNWVDSVLMNLRHHPKAYHALESHFEKMGITTHQVMIRVSDYEEQPIPRIERFGNYVVATHVLRDVPVSQWFLKRVLDIIGGLVGLLLTGLIYLFVAPQIKKADPGPVFYASSRVGKNGRLFKMYKFRSMYQDADARKAELMSQNKMKGFMFKMDDDPRIIGSEKKDENGKPKGIGNFIRNTSLDEFPQFLNVLKGDMSLVGTRPPTPDEWIQYSEEHRIRLSMRPGITGMWQVSGRSDITDFEEVVRLDEEYIESWTVAKDIKILMQTVLSVLQHKGAS